VTVTEVSCSREVLFFWSLVFVCNLTTLCAKKLWLVLLRDSKIIFAGTAALKERKQSTSVNKLYCYTSVSVIVQVESVMGDKDLRAACLLTCSLLICVFPSCASLHSNKAVSAEDLINFRGSSVATTKRPVHRRLASQYSAHYIQISRFFLLYESRRHKCSRNQRVVSAPLTTNATFSMKK